jgi:hypothetical protein
MFNIAISVKVNINLMQKILKPKYRCLTLGKPGGAFALPYTLTYLNSIQHG